MVPEFENFSFNNPAGTVGVVKTSYGLHIVEAMGTTPPQRRVEVAFDQATHAIARNGSCSLQRSQ